MTHLTDHDNYYTIHIFIFIQTGNERLQRSTEITLALTLYCRHTKDHRHCNSDNDQHLKGSVEEPNKFHIYETEKITHKASDTAEYIELFGSFTRDRRARRI